jgi:putative Mg2+ transporter-C (MgtC) family protein
MEAWYLRISDGGDPAVIASRMLLALVFGAVVGWDREQAGKAAGLRTHMMVSVGAATFSLLAFEDGAALAEQHGKDFMQPTRVLQGIVGGLGFLGAGSIIKSRSEEDISGLTTAASIWVAGGLGAAAGMGALVTGALGAALAVVILRVARGLERFATRNRK